VLGNLLQLEGFAHESSEQVRDELRARLDAAASTGAASTGAASTGAGAAGAAAALPSALPAGALGAIASLPVAALDVPMYAIDAVLRRSPALQATAIARAGGAA
jgi:NADH-quinone oxidoreductase subunit G